MIKKERLEFQGGKGFTLIEILIVVAIIAILASVVLIGLGPTQQAGRDARRISDLRQIQNGLELYFNKCGYYPGDAVAGSCAGHAHVATTGYNGGATTAKAALTGSAIGINSVPDDPNSSQHYVYRTDAGGSTYLLEATLENQNNSIFNSYSAPATGAFTAGDALPAGGCAAPDYCVTL